MHYNVFLRNFNALPEIGNSSQSSFFRLPGDKSPIFTGEYSHELIENVKFDGNLYKLRVCGCMSKVQVNRLDIVMSQGYIEKKYDITKKKLPILVSTLQFQKYKKWISQFHPIVEAFFQQHKSTRKNPAIRLHTGNGYMNYILMCLWRNLWTAPRRVVLINYLSELGYDKEECIYLSASQGAANMSYLFPSNVLDGRRQELIKKFRSYYTKKDAAPYTFDAKLYAGFRRELHQHIDIKQLKNKEYIDKLLGK